MRSASSGADGSTGSADAAPVGSALTCSDSIADVGMAAGEKSGVSVGCTGPYLCASDSLVICSVSLHVTGFASVGREWGIGTEECCRLPSKCVMKLKERTVPGVWIGHKDCVGQVLTQKIGV